MKVLLVGNAHFYKNSAGEYYTASIYNKTFFDRYLSVFDSVRFIAKMKYTDDFDASSMIKVNFANVEIVELPWYKGPGEMVGVLGELIKIYKGVFKGCDCCILRIAQLESTMAYIFRRRNIPIAAEVVNDPSSFTDISSSVRRIVLYYYKKIIENAIGVSYVTESAIQKKYPCRAMTDKRAAGYFTGSYSSIELDDKYIREPKRIKAGEKLRLVHVANNISGESKGHRTVIDALSKLKADGISASVTFIGNGVSVDMFKEYAAERGVADRVDFIGKIADKKLYFDTLAKCDVLIFPSHFEGLPRVVIEAMACGLPCAASPVGGTGELISDPGFLIDPLDADGYAAAIKRLCDPETYFEYSQKSIETSKKYAKTILDEKRKTFYTSLKNSVNKN